MSLCTTTLKVIFPESRFGIGKVSAMKYFIIVVAALLVALWSAIQIFAAIWLFQALRCFLGVK